MRVGAGAAVLVLSVRDDEARPPPGRPTAVWRLNRLGVHPTACNDPRDHGVRVPHLTRAELVTTPHRGRDPRDCVKHAPSARFLVAEPPRAGDGLRDIRYVATGPEPDLVAEDPKLACPARADGALGDDATLHAAPVVDRRLLDHERSLRDF